MRTDQRNRHLVLGLLCSLMLFCTSSFAADEVLEAGQIGDEPVFLTEYFDVLEDTGRQMSLADVQTADIAARFTRPHLSSQSLNFGLSTSAYWLRLKLRNSSDHTLDQLLEISYPRLIRVDFFRISQGMPDQVIESGYAKPFASRAYKHRFFVFPVALPAQSEQVIYLRVESRTSVEVPAKLWNRSAFHIHERIDYMMQAAYFGMAAAMLLFNLLLLISLRDRGYLFYIMFVASVALSIASLTGVGIEYVWGNVPAWTTISFAIAAHLCAIFLVAFMRHMMGTATLLPRSDKVLKASIAINVVAGLVTLFSYQIVLTLVIVIVNAFLILGIAVVSCFKKQRSAYIFLAAFMLLLMGVIVLAMRILGILPTNFLTVNGVQIGAAIEMIVLAFALADRFHVIRAEKERAQAQIVDSLRSSERSLETRVEERTAELTATVARLQQTQNDLVQAEKLASLGSLVAGVSHELNTPIGNALTTASTLQDDAKDFQRTVSEGGVRRSALDGFLQRSVDMSALLVRSCYRAAHLISSFKQVAVDQTSELQRQFDLLTLIQDNVASLQPSFRGAAWTITVDVPSGINCNSYPGPLGQVLVNLIQNAGIHAFEPGATGHLNISASADADSVEIVLADNGHGMSEETLEHVFEPFFTTRLGKGGSGLGLAICRNIVTGILGGQLTATSQLGVGSQFILRIPIVAPRAISSGRTI